ncbi:MAG: Gfo/Idh/MocA family oxidoreductase [Akkermansia sp.]
MDTSSSRRRFLQTLGLATGAVATGSFVSGCNNNSNSKIIVPNPNEIGPLTTWPARKAGAKYMGGFRAPKLDVVKIAFVGVGHRGTSHVRQMAVIEGAEIVGICDLYQDFADRSAAYVEEKTGKRPPTFCKGETDYLRMFKEVKPDAVIICPSWEWHARITCDAMKNDIHAFTEVPIAVKMNEIWDIVNTCEQTGKHCMQMENVNYGRDELLFLNMVRQGVIGDLLHGEAAYIHELRSQMQEDKRGTGSWRTYHYAESNGNLYPTHGLGPVAQYMNLARTDDNFGRLVSFSSPALGRAAYGKKNFPADHKWNKLTFTGGDMNTSIIKTTKGRTVLVEWDETSPRPYSRMNLIQGVLGTLAGFPTRVAGEQLGDGNYHKWIEGEKLAPIYEKYEHPLWKRVGPIALKMGGHGGMDYVMLYRMIECLRKGEPMDQNVYEGAFWSAVTPLSIQSVAEGGMPIVFPDFTRGDWKTTAPLGIVE